MVGLLCVAAALAVAVTAAVGIPRASIGNGDPSLIALEPGGSKAHHSTRADARADARRRIACRRMAYRRAHRASCPAQPARGKRAFEAVQAAGTGSWGAPFTVASWPIHQILLPTGRVLWLTYADDHEKGGRAFVWDPATRQSREIDPPPVKYADGVTRPANLFCSGHAALADGRILVAGGNLAFPDPAGGPGSDFKGARWVFTFDPWTETWTRQPDMAHGRWYPDVTTLPDGTAVIIGGTDESGDNVNNPDIEHFTPSAAVNGVGALSVVAHRATTLYPHAFVVPDGTAAGAPAGTQVLVAGPSTSDTWILNTADWSFRDVPDLPTPRLWGSALLLPSASGAPSKVMLIGGSDLDVTPSAQRTTVVLDLNDVAAGWRPGASMATGRSHLNVSILPDDSLLAVGGGGGLGNGSLYVDPVFTAERYSPATGSWSSAGAQVDERTYHSTALLLPDGRVLSAGDDRSSHSDPSMRRGELYSPPYLASGARPTIDSAPVAVRYGVPFGVRAGGAVDHAVLIHPSAVTHADDMSQRSIRLAMTDAGGGALTLTSPSDPSAAPPGYYMLFLVDAQGRPSVAHWIRLDPAAADAPAAVAGAPSGGAPGGAAATSTASATPNARPHGRAVPVHVSAVRLRGRTLRLTLALALPARTAAKLSLVPPSRRAAKRPPALVRRLSKGRARTGSVVVAVRVPRGWHGLSLPLMVRIRGAKLVKARERVLVERARPRPRAWTVTR